MMPAPAKDAQSLDEDHRSAGEHLECSTKEFQPLQPGSDLAGMMEMWWDGSYDWSVGMEGYRFFRKDRQGRGGGGVALYANDQIECMDLCLGMDREPTESLWFRVKGKAGTGDVMLGICYWPPDQQD
ncbi:hypothetical protein llap_4335 [Limosa lapponica baueri]|uniref:Uncharacterized protein n=1 Tax=Limosa lapponica baueri TaxID=1758121 RepID=A0A2I0UH79_LIMLA|nr:hypothetical protein llap_4335 [Limosa lapponica baueri]